MNTKFMKFHGPALTRALNIKENTFSSLDQSCALHFSYWSNAADDFLTRHRATGWPTQCMLKDIEEGGFYMTPCIRYKNSRTMEWRYSFTNAETQLAKSLSDIQRTTYVHVKLLRNIYFKSPDVLKSYFLKTILFWLCEKVPQSCWRLDNMASMIRLFLDHVILAFTEGHLEHYFIRGANLLEGITVESRRTLVKQVKVTRDNLLEYVMHFDKRVSISGCMFRTSTVKLFHNLIHFSKMDTNESISNHYDVLVKSAKQSVIMDSLKAILEVYKWQSVAGKQSVATLPLTYMHITTCLDIILNELEYMYKKSPMKSIVTGMFWKLVQTHDVRLVLSIIPQVLKHCHTRFSYQHPCNAEEDHVTFNILYVSMACSFLILSNWREHLLYLWSKRVLDQQIQAWLNLLVHNSLLNWLKLLIKDIGFRWQRLLMGQIIMRFAGFVIKWACPRWFKRPLCHIFSNWLKRLVNQGHSKWLLMVVYEIITKCMIKLIYYSGSFYFVPLLQKALPDNRYVRYELMRALMAQDTSEFYKSYYRYITAYQKNVIMSHNKGGGQGSTT